MRSLFRHKRAVLASLAILGIGLTATTAAFTDTSDTTAVITAGTVDIQAGASAGTVGNTTYTIPVTVQPNGKAGWTSTQTVTIKNAGTLPFTVTAAAPALAASVNGKGGAANSGTNMAGVIDASLTSAAGAGVTITGGPGLFTGKLNALSIAGAKTYTVTPGSTDVLTLVLSGDLPDGYQGASITVNFSLNVSPA